MVLLQTELTKLFERNHSMYREYFMVGLSSALIVCYHRLLLSSAVIVCSDRRFRQGFLKCFLCGAASRSKLTSSTDFSSTAATRTTVTTVAASVIANNKKV